MVNMTATHDVVSDDDTVSDDALDFGTDARPPQSAVDDAFAQLEQLVHDEAEEAARISRLEAELRVAKARHDHIVERAIPELMTDVLKQKECVTRGGVRVRIKRAVRASLPSAKERPDDRAQAIAWLLANGHGGVIKNKVVVTLDKGEDSRATELLSMLRDQNLDASADKDVPHQTLGALVRELLADGRSVPKKLLNVFDQNVAELKR